MSVIPKLRYVLDSGHARPVHRLSRMHALCTMKQESDWLEYLRGANELKVVVKIEERIASTKHIKLHASKRE